MRPKDYKPTISFCITCKGRLHHLEKTLKQNIENNADYDHVQFVVVDYDSKDGLEQWMKKHYSHQIETGLIKYVKLAAKEGEDIPFHMSHAKNLAHRMADGDILCNLDADNITPQGFASWVAEEFSRAKRYNDKIFIAPKPLYSGIHTLLKGRVTGVNGRIVVTREDFERVRGYNEQFQGCRDGQDTDFAGRLEAAGVTRRKMDLDMYGSVVQHGNGERIQHLSPDNRLAAEKRLASGAAKGWTGKLHWALHGHQPTQRSSDDVNPSGNVGCAEVFINFSDKAEAIPPFEPAIANTTQRSRG